eukprot:377358_1
MATEEKESKVLRLHSLVVATRLFLKPNTILTDTKTKQIKSKFESLCVQVFGYCNKLFIAIDGRHQKELIQILNQIKSKFDSNKYHIEYIIVSPWIGVTSALNSIIQVVSMYAKNNNTTEIKYISFQSMEINKLSLKIMDLLVNKYMDENTLVCGPVLVDSQFIGVNDKKCKIYDINGQNIPWNTLNIWNLKKLQPFGFSLVSDGIIDDLIGGIEEVVTISIIQQINGFDINQCKLIKFVGNGFDIKNDLHWNTDFKNDIERVKYHETKMKSKVERAELQLKQMKNLKVGKVMHIKHTIL